MKFTKPAWVMHHDNTVKAEEAKRLSIFSVHVHPDDSRIATGGLDARVRIWSTKPILNEAAEISNKPPKLLCSLTMHSGPVLCVRWAHSGKWLASGSDDQVIMVWDHDPNAKGRVWGSDEVNVEGWKFLKRLVGHESDVTDLAWSPGDRYLASVGLDSQIFVWCGFTLDRLRVINQHQGFVKGVCWDPVGEFLATQSDDRSVKIWRTKDWEQEAEVRKPFEDSPGSTFFRRLSWSPDGAHITASNATNNKGYVFIAAVITRATWTSEISLVGHENTVEVACYNPHIFLRNPTGPVQTSNICSVVALGSDDRSVSVWQTKSARPLIVAKEVFERPILDLSWSWSGRTLYAVSSDGTLGVLDFEAEELEGIAPFSAQKQYLHKFDFVPPPIPEGYSHDVPVTPQAQCQNQSSQVHTGFEQAVNGTSTGERVNKLVAKRKDKKRIQPTLVNGSGSGPSTSKPPAASSSSSSKPNGTSSHSFGDGLSTTASTSSTPILLQPPPLTAVAKSKQSSHAASPVSSTFQSAFPFNDDFMDIDSNMEVPIESLGSNVKGKRKADSWEEGSSKPSKSRTLGGDRPREAVEVKPIPGGSRAPRPSEGDGWGILRNVDLLPAPSTLTFLSTKVEGGEDLFEAKNAPADGGPYEAIYVSGNKTQWLDYLPCPVVLVTATSAFCAAALQDGSVNVYSPTGRRLMPTLALGSPCAFMESSKNSLMVVTTSGQLHVWDIKSQKAAFPPTSVLPVLQSASQSQIVSTSIRPNGSPIIQCSSGIAFSYDSNFFSWVKVGDRWWSEGSDAWQGRQRVNTQVNSRGIVASMEGDLRTPVHPDERSYLPPDDTSKPTWWSTAMTLGHLETRLHAAKVLDSPQEFKQTLLVYAKKIADEGFRAKAEELIKEFFGPLYWRPGRDDQWTPSVMGFSKRDLLKDVLTIFARSKTLTKLAMDWQDLLKKACNDD
ncbi:hypothetical protein JAAARDRAFT_125533 [Jaapia argillacea MUCL 33604]|uniref:Protein HIR n=1 Tax=Jaapia argillacea MUCL 33604 TaxID=933084 RepID=A0A067QBX2_9AGAM|nr:hypothetical protein JAAARDRAFT_125533 [Jaapia argillacea MUCL 33604]